MSKLRLQKNTDGQLLEQFWMSPKNSIVYATLGQPDNGFNNEIEATPLYNAAIGSNNQKLIQAALAKGEDVVKLMETLPSATLDGDLAYDMDEYVSHLGNHRIKEAALLSGANPSVNVVSIYSQLYGLRDRDYAGTELARRVATEELIVNFDKVIKMEGLEQITEMQMPRQKNIGYNRVILETSKYGMLIRISDESIRKNVHDPYQDSVTVAGTKVIQRKSYDVVFELSEKLPSTVGLPWDTYEPTGVSRSTNDPGTDIMRIITATIEGTNNGAKWDRMGLHQIGGRIYDRNTFFNGVNAPAPTAVLAPGTRTVKGFDRDVLMVNDQFITQGKALMTDVGTEACCILLEGPVNIATKVDEFLKTKSYAIIDYHKAEILNPDSGVQMTGVYTPLSPPS